MQSRTVVVAGLAAVFGIVVMRSRSSRSEPQPAIEQSRVRTVEQLVAHAGKLHPRAPQAIEVRDGELAEPDGDHQPELDDLVARLDGAGAIWGEVRDVESGEPLAGVTITVSSPALAGAQTAISDEHGRYTIISLPPGEYVVNTYYLEVAVEDTGVTVAANTATELPQILEVANAVRQPITISEDYVRTIPIPRTFESVLGEAEGTEDLGISLSGGTSIDNVYILE
jgi:hypothetical protein